jgi:hypothetical protein
VDENVDPAVVVQRHIDDRLATGRSRDGIGARDGFSTGGGDLTHHLPGRSGVGTIAGQAAAGIIDDDLCAVRCQQQGV